MMSSTAKNSTNSITTATVKQQQEHQRQLMGLNICVMVLCLMVVALTVSNIGVEHMTTRMIQEIQPSIDIIETMLLTIPHDIRVDSSINSVSILKSLY